VIRYLDEPPATADLVVIGGGVVGAATAFHCARAGLDVVLIEARPQLCTLTTPVAAGAYRLQFEEREELELVRESVQMFKAFEDITRQSVYELEVKERGYLWLASTEGTAANQQRIVDQLHSWGQTDVELIAGDDVRQRWPWVGPGAIQARWRAGDGFLDTKVLTFGLVAGSGAKVVTNCAAKGVELEGERVKGISTSRGTISCGAIAVCAGPLSSPLLDSVGVSIPVETFRRQKLIIDEETGTHWRPAYVKGAWLLHTDRSTPASEPTMDVPTDHRFAFALLDPSSPHSVARTAPFWRDVWERGSDHWLLQAGQYVVTPDFRPLIGRTQIEGLHVNTGYSGHGIMLSPAASRFVSEAIAGGSNPNPFSPLRKVERRPHPTL
jgi:sarcosine oxidase, subunit beta